MADNFDELRGAIRSFVAARDWSEFHTPKNLAMALSVEVGELTEILQWLTPTESIEAGSHPVRRPALEDEIADVLIYLICLAEALGIDPVRVAFDKLDRNETRFPPGGPFEGRAR